MTNQQKSQRRRQFSEEFKRETVNLASTWFPSNIAQSPVVGDYHEFALYTVCRILRLNRAGYLRIL